MWLAETGRSLFFARVQREMVFLLSICVCLWFSSCRSSRKTASSEKKGDIQKKGKSSYDENALVKKAHKYLGVRYKLGGDNPSGFDCSGFTRFIYRQFGIELPATSVDQAAFGKEISREHARKGDLIFFKGGDAKSRTVGHVGIVVTERGEPIRFIHASTSKGIMVSALEEKYFRIRFVRVRRVI